MRIAFAAVHSAHRAPQILGDVESSLLGRHVWPPGGLAFRVDTDAMARARFYDLPTSAFRVVSGVGFLCDECGTEHRFQRVVLSWTFERDQQDACTLQELFDSGAQSTEVGAAVPGRLHVPLAELCVNCSSTKVRSRTTRLLNLPSLLVRVSSREMLLRTDHATVLAAGGTNQ